MLVVMISVIMILNKNSEKLGRRNMFFYVLRDLKRQIKEDFVFVMKQKTHILNILRKRRLIDEP